MAQLIIKELQKSFGKNRVLKGINLDFSSNGIWTILGPNASGKTTLIKSILGMVVPDSGTISIDDTEVIGTWQYKENINYLPQMAHFPENLTVKELLKMIQELRNRNGNLDLLLEEFDLIPFINKKIENLSGGTKQKLNLSIALMYDDPIYLLDEPTAGLDPVAVISLKKILNELKDQGKLIIITTHIIPLVEELTDKIIFLLEGKIKYSGLKTNLINNYDSKSLEDAIAKMLEE